MSLHPQVAALLARVALSRLPPYGEVPPTAARRQPLMAAAGGLRPLHR